MKHLTDCINHLFDDSIVNNIAVRVSMYGDVIAEEFRSIVPEKIITDETLFDMASITKIMVTTPLALIALDQCMFSLNTHVADFFPGSEDKGITIFNLMNHTLGIGHRPLNKTGNTYDNIAEYILSLPLEAPVGSKVLYSCPGFILLGKILEKIYGERLDKAFTRLVAEPLGLKRSSFLPDRNGNDFVNSNISEDELGLVNDYNCRFLGGVAGNAGLFSCIKDVSLYVNALQAGFADLISPEIFNNAVLNQTAILNESRALGFLYVDDRYAQTGTLFAPGSIGHCGHTGQSVFVNRESGLSVIILSDATAMSVKKYGNEHYDEVCAMRATLHNAIAADFPKFAVR